MLCDGALTMTAQETCSWLRHISSGYACRHRNQVLPVAEVTGKCSKIEKSVLCVDAYSALTKGQEMINAKSTDAFLWLTESATQFENLSEEEKDRHTKNIEIFWNYVAMK